MAKCPHCQTEYTPEPGQEFCDNCGKLLKEVPPAAGPAPIVSAAATLLAAPPTVGDVAIPDNSGDVKVTAVGEGNPQAGT